LTTSSTTSSTSTGSQTSTPFCPNGKDSDGNCISNVVPPNTLPATTSSTTSSTSIGSQTSTPFCPNGKDSGGNCIPNVTPSNTLPSTTSSTTSSTSTGSQTSPPLSCLYGVDALGNCIVNPPNTTSSASPTRPNTLICSPGSINIDGVCTQASQPPSSITTATTSPPVIAFPANNNTFVPTTSTTTTSSLSLPSANAQFSYVTATTLLVPILPTSTNSFNLTNPDAATTTLSFIGPSNPNTGSAPPPSLPSDIPARIYPAVQTNPSDLPSDYILCSILFSSGLPWEEVVKNTQLQGQIFAWTDYLVCHALNIDTSVVFIYALDFWAPETYQSTADVDKLQTLFLFFLPRQYVTALQSQVRVAASQFYNVPTPYRDLANLVDPAFALTSVPDPNTIPGSANAATSRENKSRTNAIIGVVSALGGLAFVILGVLIFNGVKRNRELRHRRLSDSHMPNDPYPDRAGREFDQDSVGGQRRRSFYFAEDSLRGQQQTMEQPTVPMVQAQTQYVVQPSTQIEYSNRTSPGSMRERRGPVVPGAISAPILTQSSLNW